MNWVLLPKASSHKSNGTIKDWLRFVIFTCSELRPNSFQSTLSPYFEKVLSKIRHKTIIFLFPDRKLYENGVKFSGGWFMSESRAEQDAERSQKSIFSESARVVVAKNNVYCELDGESVILNVADGVYYGLNIGGNRIWELIQQPISVSEIVVTLTAEFDIDQAECRRDVEELLGQLLEKQLIEVMHDQAH